MDCPECGAHNPEDAEYCNLCFQKFGEPELSVEAPAGREAIDVTSVDVPVSPGTHIDPEIPGMAGVVLPPLLQLQGEQPKPLRVPPRSRRKLPRPR